MRDWRSVCRRAGVVIVGGSDAAAPPASSSLASLLLLSAPSLLGLVLLTWKESLLPLAHPAWQQHGHIKLAAASTSAPRRHDITNTLATANAPRGFQRLLCHHVPSDLAADQRNAHHSRDQAGAARHDGRNPGLLASAGLLPTVAEATPAAVMASTAGLSEGSYRQQRVCQGGGNGPG